MSNEPKTLTAGDSWAWSRADLAESYPPGDGWSLAYRFAPEAGGAAVDVAADAAFAVSVAPATSANFAAGRWRWAAIVTDGTARHTVGSGWLEVLPDPAAATAPDLRSDAERRLAAVEATLEGRLTKDAESYTIEGRSIARTPLDVLLKVRARLKAEVRRERGGGAMTVERVQFR